MTTSGLALRTMDDVERIARIAVASGYTACRKMEEAAMLVITGQELGLSPAQSLRGIYVVSGKPVLSADLMVAVVRRSGLCETWRVIESTAERCEIETLRKGETTSARRVWTMADAKRAGITNKATWSQYPATMLRHRCAADLARQEYSDVLMGLYDPEEMEPAEPAARPDAVRIDSREDFAALDASRQIVASPARYDAAAGHFAAVATYAGVAAETEVRTAEYRVSDAVNDLRESASIAESLTALAQRWIAAKRDVAAWDDRAAQERAWSAFKARARELGATIKALQAEIARLDTPPPPDGTDGPSGPRSAANDTATAEGSAAPSSGTDGPVARDDGGAWTLSAKGIRDHVAAITNARHLESSGRSHLREVSPTLKVHALHCYTARLRELSCREERDEEGGTVVTQTPQDVAFARVETWLREGPKDAAPPQRRTRRAA